MKRISRADLPVSDLKGGAGAPARSAPRSALRRRPAPPLPFSRLPDGFLVTMPWPADGLHPNDRVHYQAKARAVRQARQQARLLAARAGVRESGCTQVHLVFMPPISRKRDEDGMEAACKSMLDGIADALGIDDHEFKITREVGPKTRLGAVLVHLRRSHP